MSTRSSRRGQRGAAAVEFALVFAIFCMLLMGAIEMGRLLWTWNAAVEATRRGARLAAVCDLNDPEIKTRIREMLPSLTNANITIRYLSPGMAPNTCTTANCQAIEVSLTGFTYTPIIPFVSMGTLTLPPFVTTQRREWMESTGNPVCS
ncbi:TadE/TadG family type IV pilus assembly protein [Piscinibacter sp. XHJ-5]|uniref:TadE/TadG family type IV pilus assembly protein n=1 Tax=Piscinibacter sp. XHJ-5 TaxID=3037797 RepID=UPI00245348C2|nr:TadE/TadG family type IV pilus assembly protein [Piscinibacter sp. XHJ-5]